MVIDDDCPNEEFYQNKICNMILNHHPTKEMEKLDYILWYILKGYDTNDYSIDILTPISINYKRLILKDSDYIEHTYNSFKRRFKRHYYNDEPY